MESPALHPLGILHCSNMVLYGWILIFGGAKSREKLGKEKEGAADTSLTEIQFITPRVETWPYLLKGA